MELASILGPFPFSSEPDPVVPLDAEVQLQRLREAAAVHRALCPFAIGDVITPRRDAALVGWGQPHVVIEVLADPPLFAPQSSTDDVSSSKWGLRPSVRVMSLMGSRHVIAAHWVEHWMMVRWTPELFRLSEEERLREQRDRSHRESQGH